MQTIIQMFFSTKKKKLKVYVCVCVCSVFNDLYTTYANYTIVYNSMKKKKKIVT